MGARVLYRVHMRYITRSHHGHLSVKTAFDKTRLVLSCGPLDSETRCRQTQNKTSDCVLFCNNRRPWAFLASTVWR
jgi:hypothetical protein